MFHDLAGRWRLPRLPPNLLRRLLGLSRRAPTRAERLAMFPASDLPLERTATIRWNDHLVPFIEARTDRDLAFCLGMAHAHLREGQMEFLKLLAQGRLAEFLGPLALDVDHAIRIVDFAFAADATERRMPQETRTWTQAYVDALNRYWARAPRRAPEFRLLGRGHEPWTVRDVLTVGRLVGAGFHWLAHLPLLKPRTSWTRAKPWSRPNRVASAARTSLRGCRSSRARGSSARSRAWRLRAEARSRPVTWKGGPVWVGAPEAEASRWVGPPPQCGTSAQIFRFSANVSPVRTTRNRMTLSPAPLRASSLGSAAQVRNWVTSRAIWSTVAAVPSA
jgi:hypothetical protein